MGKLDIEEFEETNRQIDSDTKCNSKQQEIVEKANERPEWLPDGWKVEVRTRKSGAHMGSGYKCYIDPLKGYKFYSKPEVLRYLETIKDNSCTSKKKKCTNMHSPSSICTIKDNSCTSKEEEKCTNMHSPSSICTIKDNSCTSKKEEKCTNMHSPSNICTIKDNSCTSKEEEKCTNMHSPSSICTVKDNSCTSKKEQKCTNMHSPSNVVVEKSTVEDLPPGWTKEVKIRKNSNGIRKDPFYKDPVNGYVFRSKKDVLRYLESGDIGKCAFKPSRRQIQDKDNLTPSPAAKRQKLKQSAPKQRIFVAKELAGKSSLELPDDNTSRKGQDVNMSSGIMVAPVPPGESVVKMHSPKDEAANPPEMKKTSVPDGVQEKEHVVNMMENANEKNHSNHSISKNKEFNVDHRFSRRLAGIEPVQLADNVINEQTLQVPKQNLRKSRTNLDADMENKSSQHFNGVPEIEHVHKMLQDAMNTSSTLSEDQVVFKEQPHQLERYKIEDNKPEIHTSSNKSSKKKQHCVPRRTSKRLAVLQQSEAGPVTELADHAPINGESGNKRRKSPKIPAIADNQLEKPKEDEEIADEKPEPQLSFAFHYSWSDPCLEFAINTLTGVLPPVENSVDNGPSTVPETDIQKTLFDNVAGSRDSQNNPVDNGPTAVPETDIQKTLFDNVTGRSRDSQNNVVDNVTGSRDRSPQVRSNKSKRKKEFKVPVRLSKRLAGLEPEVLPSERALEYSARKPCKEETTATAILTNGASDHLDAGEETKLTFHASDSLKTEVLGDSSNKSEKSYDAQTVHREQLQKVEADNIGDDRSEPQLSLPFGDSWSDPCLEFAIKTLTGALHVDSAAEILPVTTPDVDDLPNNELHGRVTTSINGEARDNSNQSHKKKELNMDGQPSKLLLGKPELRTSSTSCENVPKFTAGESHNDEGNIIRNLDGEPLHIEAGNVTQLAHHSRRNINSRIHEEPLKKNQQVVEGEFGKTQQPPLQTETLNHDNTELQFCDSFMNSWSDPCLEFAFKTLTGVIPVEENFAIQGCIQEPANCHERRDGSSTLPDFGSSSFSQNDISFHYDTGVKSMPGQQSSMSSSFSYLEKTNLQSCPGVDPQKHYSQCNNNFQRR